MNINKRIEYIETLLEKRNGIFLGGPYNLIIHSVLNTIDLYVLLDYYLAIHSESEIRKSIESNIYKRTEYTNDYELLFDGVLQRLDGADYYQRQRIRKILILLIPHLAISYRKHFFDIFYNSKYIYDTISALSISKEIWNSNLDEVVLVDYLKKGNDAYLKAFLENGEISYSLPYLEQIWALEPNDYLKMKLIIGLSRDYIEAFYFLRQSEPDKYLLAMSFSNKEIDDKTVTDCYNDIAEDLKPYGLMCLGRLNKWTLLEKEIKKYIC